MARAWWSLAMPLAAVASIIINGRWTTFIEGKRKTDWNERDQRIQLRYTLRRTTVAHVPSGWSDAVAENLRHRADWHTEHFNCIIYLFIIIIIIVTEKYMYINGLESEGGEVYWNFGIFHR